MALPIIGPLCTPSQRSMSFMYTSSLTGRAADPEQSRTRHSTVPSIRPWRGAKQVGLVCITRSLGIWLC